MDSIDILSLILSKLQDHDLCSCLLLSKFHYGFRDQKHFWRLRLQQRYNVLISASCYDLYKDLAPIQPNSEDFFTVVVKYGVHELIEPRTIRNNLANDLLEVAAVHGHLNLVKLFYEHLGRFSNFRTGLDQLIEKVEESGHYHILNYIFSKVVPRCFQLISDENVEELRVFIRGSYINKRVWILMIRSLGKSSLLEQLGASFK